VQVSQLPAELRSSSMPELTNRTFEPVLHSEEAAALLGIHPKTLQKMARKGLIPGFRIGKLWAFRASALNEWLEQRQTG
jgi:excisionase family DNA binding protein